MIDIDDEPTPEVPCASCDEEPTHVDRDGVTWCAVHARGRDAQPLDDEAEELTS